MNLASLKKLNLPVIDSDKVQRFIARWQNTEGAGAELADFQSFILELCDILSVPKPDPKSDSTKDAAYIFERPVDSFTSDGEKKTSKNRIDLYRRDCFVMEGKQSGKKVGSQGWNNAMHKAKNQADNYVRSLPTDEGRPPFIVVVDVGRSIQLHSEFSKSGGIYVPFPDPSHYLIKLENLTNSAIQQRLQTLWLSPEALDPNKYAAKVTRDVSVKLAELAKSLEESGYNVDRTSHFLKRCLFTMFCEDVELIPEDSFTNLLEELKETPEYFADSMSSLWNTMNTGGFEGQLRKVLPRFNGGLFSDIDPISLSAEQIKLLIEAAKADWRYVEPAIFGTLLERALDPRERHKLGAHYTPRAYVERLIMPTIIEPLREEWETVKVTVEMLLQQSKKDKAVEALNVFHFHLCEIKVLDPACGSANFLYVALEHIKRLEGEVLNAIRDLNAGQNMLDTWGLMVDLHQFLGIEINPRAAAIAEIVLWIGFLQWNYRINGKIELPEPLLRDFKNIEKRDALIEFDSRDTQLDNSGEPLTIWDGISYKISSATGERIPDESRRTLAYNYINPRKAIWPKADYIIGNPPYLGARRSRLALGDGYLKAIRSVYKEVPENADYVMYWWHISAEKLGCEQVQRLGLITTNSLRQSFCRRVVENSLASFSNIAIANVIPDHPWVDSSDGAAVRVSMITAATNLTKGTVADVVEEIEDGEAYTVRFKFSEGIVTPNLNVGADPAGSELLLANSGLSSVGYQLTGKGFVLNKSQTDHFAEVQYRPLIKPLMSGRDINQSSRNLFSLDLFGIELEQLENEYLKAYQWVLERVLPERSLNSDHSSNTGWWLYARTRPDFRPALSNITQLYATSLTAKHRFFVGVDSNTVCDSTTVMFAFSDTVHWGVISSRVHVCWALVAGGRLGVGNDTRYNKTKCFETFPFPECTKIHNESIREAIEKIEFHRRSQQIEYSKLTLTNMYNVLEKLRRDEPLSKKEQGINLQGLVSILRVLHDNLDRAVFNAYGWEDLGNILVGMPGATTPLPDKSDEHAEAEEELLIRLVKLNHRRTTEEAQGHIRWLRPDYQSPNSQQPDINIDVDSTHDITENKTITKKATWPKEMRDQINIILELLSTPTTAEVLANSFKRKPIKHVNAVLNALETLGKAQKENDLWHLN